MESGPPISRVVSFELNMRVIDLGLKSKKNLVVADVGRVPGLSVDSERDLAVTDVGGGPCVQCGLETRPEAYSLDPQWAS